MMAAVGMAAGASVTAVPTAPAPGLGSRAGRAFADLPLARKVALIPVLTLLLMGVMLAGGVQLNLRSTAALRSLDADVLEPLDRARAMQEGVTLLHTRLFALLSSGANESDLAAQKAREAALRDALGTRRAALEALLATPRASFGPAAEQLRLEFGGYEERVKKTLDFAAYDTSWGELLAGGADDQFVRLNAHLDELVAALSQRREAVTAATIAHSDATRWRLAALAAVTAALALLGAVAVGRGITRPLRRLTALTQRLAGGDTDVAVPDTERHDEVGAMARAVEVFRANALARRQGEEALQRTNEQFHTALDCMQQGLLVWDGEGRLRIVNRRFLEIMGLPEGTVVPGMSLRETLAASIRQGLHPGQDVETVLAEVEAILGSGRAFQAEIAFRPGLDIRVSGRLLPDGGNVVTFEDVTEKRRHEEKVAYMASHDALTGLPNRTMLQERLRQALGSAEAARGVAVLCLDLDHFKDVNDTLGHGTGDALLRQVATRLLGSVGKEEMVVRLGGDEFAVLITTAYAGARASRLATRLVERLAAPYLVDGHQVVTSTSVGVASAEDATSADDLLKQADIALYRAKEERGSVRLFRPGMDAGLRARRSLEDNLRAAIRREQFELHYQPLLRLADGRVTGFESLLRWKCPSRGLVPPNDFIPIAEQTGLIVPIGEWVLRAACAEAADWPEDIRLAVNLSPVQFRDRRLVQTVEEALDLSGLDPRRVELEITESSLLKNTEAVMSTLQRLHGLGVRISMDDFGTGYSSLSYLRRFPFDKIKIDRSFVSDIGRLPDCAFCAVKCRRATPSEDCADVIVRALARLGDSLGLTTTAEGVETVEQLAHLRRHGCTEAQGFLISRPRPAGDVAAMVRADYGTLLNPARKGVLRPWPAGSKRGAVATLLDAVAP
jgi:diguanylate cyclase (GGDEF)-like protein